MLVVAWPEVMPFVLLAGYAVSGVIEKGVSLLVKPLGKRGGTKSDQAVSETKQ